jgi:hypothetical protein
MKYYTSTTQFNCGIDLHARQRYVCLMDRDGHKLVHTNIRNNDFDFFLKLIAPYRHDLTVCAECMFGWYWLADACQEARLNFVLAHPEAGERSAVIYTLLGSCRRHGLNPFDYLKDLFTRLPAAKITHIKEFTPAAWAKAKDQVDAQAA